MKIIITHYKKADNGIDTLYQDGKPITEKTKANLPLRFGYGSYNEPMKILSQGINVTDIISIEEYDESRALTS